VEQPIKVGVSSCLLGNQVRYDGGHKLDRFITDTLGRFVSYVPVCPEVECGFTVPREAMRLIGDPRAPRLVTVRGGQDHTDRMLAWARQRLLELEKEGLCGFIFKSDSPSSGMERVKVYDPQGMPHRTGAGVFASAFMERFPLIPVEDDGRLHDLKLRENFIAAIFTLRRWRDFLAPGMNLGALVAFHTHHKLLILSHSPNHYRTMGKLVAQAHNLPMSDLASQYETLLVAALRLKATSRKHVNVLQHLMGYFKKQLSPDEKRELLEVIDRYGREQIPLIVPITLINHYVRKYQQSYLKGQYYLNPHPVELQLRNHV
jgi:uncharacterized protein YbgA (DUF1722 family)/uncharacterized protein YbbK (DUF523 family)